MSDNQQSEVRSAMNPLRKRNKQIPALFIFLAFLLLAAAYRVYTWI